MKSLFNETQDYEEKLSFNVIYEDENGKEWRFCRLKKKRAFVLEYGKKFSHTHVYNQYSFVRAEKEIKPTK